MQIYWSLDPAVACPLHSGFNLSFNAMKRRIFTTKTLLVMKLTLLFLLIGVQVCAVGRSQTVTLSVKNSDMKRVFATIKKQTGFKFFFDEHLIDEAGPISISADDMNIENFLEVLFKDLPLRYTIKNKTIIVSRKPPVFNITGKEEAPAAAIGGVVTDLENNPIIGATITLKGTKTATGADGQGKFQLNGIPDNYTLIVSAVGYMPLQIVVANNTFSYSSLSQPGETPEETEGNSFGTARIISSGRMEIKLARLAKSIETVVITGISQRSSNNFTGSSKTISGSEIKKVNTTSVFAAVSALDPSFRVLPNNITGGNINQLPQIQLRGQNSFPNLTGELSANPNAPLFILDGFEVTLERVANLDMNLISSITLLKDASATAIYGSRGANGVMVITTIAPAAGKVQVTVTNDFRVSTPDLSVYDLLDAKDKLDFERRAGVYTSTSVQAQHRLDVLQNERFKAMLAGVNTDWLALPTQTGVSNRSSLYLQGGGQSVRYGLQFGADLQSGVMKGQNRKNYSGQFDINYLLPKIQFRNSIRVFQNQSNESPYGDFGEYVSMNPYWAPYDEEGRPKRYLENIVYPYGGGNYGRQVQTNPLYDATLHSVNRSQLFGISNNLQIRYRIRPSFYLESNFSINKQNASTDQFYSALDSRFDTVLDVNRKGTYTVRNENVFGYESLTSANLNMSRGKHQIFSTLAFNFASNKSDYYAVITEGFPFDRLDHLLFGAQYQANGRPSGEESTIRRSGVVYSGNYSYDNRFLFDVSARRDGSSQYGSDKKFGTFWSTGAGWNIHNESFFQTSDLINRLKIRASYGSTGSLNIPAYSAQSRYNFGVSTSYYGELGATLIALGNDFLSWQNVYKTNVGVDAVLFREKLDLRVDIYRENTKNSLTQVTLAPSTGFSSFAENLGEIENTGLEFAFRYKVIENRAEGILWSVNINGFSNSNILKKLSSKLKASNDKLNENNTDQRAPNVLFEEGESLNTIYAVRSLGVDPATGSEVFLAKDGSKTFEWNAADKVAVGIAQPKWNGNFGTNVLLKGFELNVILNYQFGGQLYNQTLVDRVESVDPRLNVDRRAYNLGWSEPGDISKYTRITTSAPATRLTSRFVQDDDNLILSSASIGYNFYRSALIKKLGLRSLQVTAITNDAFRFSSIQIERGISNPFARTYSLTIRAGF